MFLKGVSWRILQKGKIYISPSLLRLMLLFLIAIVLMLPLHSGRLGHKLNKIRETMLTKKKKKVLAIFFHVHFTCKKYIFYNHNFFFIIVINVNQPDKHTKLWPDIVYI